MQASSLRLDAIALMPASHAAPRRTPTASPAWLPVRRLRSELGNMTGAPPLALPAPASQLTPDAIYERSMRVALQVTEIPARLQRIDSNAGGGFGGSVTWADQERRRSC